jgi:aspartate dehydrogenase
LSSKRIAIAGLGEIGKALARKLAQGLPGLTLSAIATRDRAKAQPGSIAKASPVR